MVQWKILLLGLIALAQAAHADLDGKLEAQFGLYEKAKGYVIEKVAREKTTISRDEWENALQPAPDKRLTPTELEELKARQNEIATQAKKKAQAESKLSLDRLRKDPRAVAQFCSEMPKGGMLHVHPSGSLGPEAVERLLEKANPEIDEKLYDKAKKTGARNIDFLKDQPPRKYKDLSPREKDAVQSLFCITSANPVITFDQFEAYFTIMKLIFDERRPDFDPEFESYVEFLKRARSQGVRYVEFTRWIDAVPENLEKHDEWAAKLKELTGVTVKWNIGFTRLRTQQELRGDAERLVDLFSKKSSSSVIGVDMYGDETKGSTLDKGQVFYATLQAHNLEGKPVAQKLRCTCHSGEMGDHRNVRDALLLGSERVGHGVLLRHDPVTIEYARRNKTPIEVNLVSNQRLGVVEDLRDHPFLKFLRLGMRVSLSTDDEGIFSTDMNSECMMAIQKTDITYVELQQLAKNSISTSFASEAEKKELMAALEKDFQSFEAKWVLKLPRSAPKRKAPSRPVPRPAAPLPMAR